MVLGIMNPTLHPSSSGEHYWILAQGGSILIVPMDGDAFIFPQAKLTKNKYHHHAYLLALAKNLLDLIFSFYQSNVSMDHHFSTAPNMNLDRRY